MPDPMPLQYDDIAEKLAMRAQLIRVGHSEGFYTYDLNLVKKFGSREPSEMP